MSIGGWHLLDLVPIGPDVGARRRASCAERGGRYNATGAIFAACGTRFFEGPGSMAELCTLLVNGEPRSVAIESGETLLDVLRERLRLTGAKKGCDGGDCGACTVLIDGRPMNACLVLAASVSGRRITTIEGLARGSELRPYSGRLWWRGPYSAAFAPRG